MANKELEKISYLVESLKSYLEGTNNRGYDGRIFSVKAQYGTYAEFNSDIFDSNDDVIEHAELLTGKFIELNKSIVNTSSAFSLAQVKMISVLHEKYSGSKSGMDRLVRRDIERESKKLFVELGQFIKQILLQTGWISGLLKNEEKSLRDLGLTDILRNFNREKFEEELLSEQEIIANSDKVNSAVMLFWTNKLAKVIDSCMVGFLLEKASVDVQSEEESKKFDTKKLTEEDKIVALMRADIIKKVIQYGRKNLAVEHIGFSMIEYIMFLMNERDSEGIYKDYFEKNQDREQIYKSLPKEFVDTFAQNEKIYNSLFGNESEDEYTFLHDIYTLYVMEKTQASMYALKDSLTVYLLYDLALSKKFSIASSSSNWGIVQSKEGKENDNILFVSIPGYMKPVIVHLTPELTSLLNTASGIANKYEGNFSSQNKNGEDSFLRVNLLFKSNTAQTKILKDRRKKLASEVRILEGRSRASKDKEDLRKLEEAKRILEVLKEMESNVKGEHYHAPSNVNHTSGEER